MQWLFGFVLCLLTCGVVVFDLSVINSVGNVLFDYLYVGLLFCWIAEVSELQLSVMLFFLLDWLGLRCLRVGLTLICDFGLLGLYWLWLVVSPGFVVVVLVLCVYCVICL